VILALDTTSEFGSIALVEHGSLVEEVLLHAPDGFGHVLYDQIRRLLDRHCLGVQDLDCFAAANGPGSFTGVRVGLAAVQGLAEATGKRVAPVSNLQALAYFGSADLRATVLDARRGEVYGAVYDRDLNPRASEVVMKFQDWIKTLPSGDIELISTNPEPFAPFAPPGIPIVTAPRALASAIAQIAWRRFTAGETLDPANVDANYVRRSDAELLFRSPDSRLPTPDSPTARPSTQNT
jgi:tRNA threonylcarbamoyladenosine biosynthesis protein TsaB